MIDRHEVLVRVRANLELNARSQGRGVSKPDEADTLLLAMDPAGAGTVSPEQVDDLKRACERACDVDLADQARERANTVGMLVDAIVAALMIPEAAPAATMVESGGLTIAILWTGENEGVVAIGADRAEALRAFRQAHPSARTDNIEYVEAHAQAGGGWAATIDP